ncbi:alpha/beta fold hydrolase [Streptomyces sp. NPDC088725]|uniref:alpha/beta fold hydrolase n=1 Tax=Streptomyces sp. NPDC088725 TaxID=3365873 RepID=UPI00380858B0
MTAVFLHGVPETSAIWDQVRAHLDVDSVALPLPGFGVPRPAGFTATKDAYADWLAGSLESVRGPVDLVGHDWGALLTLRVATAYDLPLRSWTADLANCFAPQYRWHPRGQTWQTPGTGEEAVRTWLDTPADSPVSIAGALRGHGSSPRLAAAMAEQLTADTMDAILRLYRSAAPNVHRDWGSALSRGTRAPGLVVIPTEDPFNDLTASRRVAEQLHAQVVELPGLSHAWMAQDPSGAVAVLENFWRGLPA